MSVSRSVVLAFILAPLGCVAASSASAAQSGASPPVGQSTTYGTLDANGDGTVNFPEIEVYAKHLKQCDKNGDAKLSRAELAACTAAHPSRGIAAKPHQGQQH